MNSLIASSKYDFSTNVLFFSTNGISSSSKSFKGCFLSRLCLPNSTLCVNLQPNYQLKVFSIRNIITSVSLLLAQINTNTKINSMSHLLIQDATSAPDLFAKSAVVYLNYAEAEVEKHFNFIRKFKAEELVSYRK